MVNLALNVVRTLNVIIPNFMVNILGGTSIKVSSQTAILRQSPDPLFGTAIVWL
jgi:hypothetical protein